MKVRQGEEECCAHVEVMATALFDGSRLSPYVVRDDISWIIYCQEPFQHFNVYIFQY